MGRTLPTDVVLSPTDQTDRWLLDPDPRHPILFDHDGDHFPGMVLFEAARQAAAALCYPASLTPASILTDFHRYAEFDTPVWIEATPVPTCAADVLSVQVTGWQDDESVFTSLVSGPVSHQGPESALLASLLR